MVAGSLSVPVRGFTLGVTEYNNLNNRQNTESASPDICSALPPGDLVFRGLQKLDRRHQSGSRRPNDMLYQLS